MRCCDGVAIIISMLVDLGCVLRRELFPCSVLFMPSACAEALQ